MIMLTIFLTGRKNKKALGEDKNKEIQCLGLQMTEALALSAPKTVHFFYIKRIKKIQVLDQRLEGSSDLLPRHLEWPLGWNLVIALL